MRSHIGRTVLIQDTPFHRYREAVRLIVIDLKREGLREFAGEGLRL